MYYMPIRLVLQIFEFRMVSVLLPQVGKKKINQVSNLVRDVWSYIISLEPIPSNFKHNPA